jgi:hypothetical protein
LQRLDLRTHDRILFFTDGLTETRTAEGHWVPLEDVVSGLSSDPLEVALDNVATRLSEKGELLDDLAMLLIEVSPVGPDPPEAGRSDGAAESVATQ